MSATLVSNRSEQIVAGRLPRAALVAGVAAAVANVVVFYLATALGVDLTGPFMGPDAPPAALSPVQVILASLVPAFAAAALLWLLGRLTSRPITIFVVVAAVFALLSMGGPLTLPISGGAQATLAAMHIVAGAVITLLLVRQARA